MPLMARLKSETAALHAHAESRPFQRTLAAGTAPRALFASYLGELLHVHRALEASLRRHRPTHAAFAAVVHPRHEREADLLADLAFFDHTPDERLPATRDLVDAIDAAERTQPVALLGALYVLEGSMNGNAFLARALGRSWGIDPGPGLRYLSPYGDAQRETWAAFRAAMDACVFTGTEADAIVAMAQHTFTGISSISEAVARTGDPLVPEVAVVTPAPTTV